LNLIRFIFYRAFIGFGFISGLSALAIIFYKFGFIPGWFSFLLEIYALSFLGGAVLYLFGLKDFE